MSKKYYRGDEMFHAGGKPESFCVKDFWHFAFGDLLDNTRRGALAEFIVARGLGLNTEIPREDWSAYDLDYRGMRIEVKASAYLQSWNLENGKVSKPVFSVAPARSFNADSGRYTEDLCRHSDLYIFCLFTDTDVLRYNILDLTAWDFYAVLTSDLNRLYPGRKSLSLDSVKKVGVKTDYHHMKDSVDCLLPRIIY